MFIKTLLNPNPFCLVHYQHTLLLCLYVQPVLLCSGSWGRLTGLGFLRRCNFSTIKKLIFCFGIDQNKKITIFLHIGLKMLILPEKLHFWMTSDNRGVTNFNFMIDHLYFVGIHSHKFLCRTYASDRVVPVRQCSQQSSSSVQKKLCMIQII